MCRATAMAFLDNDDQSSPLFPKEDDDNSSVTDREFRYSNYHDEYTLPWRQSNGGSWFFAMQGIIALSGSVILLYCSCQENNTNNYGLSTTTMVYDNSSFTMEYDRSPFVWKDVWRWVSCVMPLASPILAFIITTRM